MRTTASEPEWLTGTDPLPMVNAVADRISDRKLRLFLVACCRRVAHLLDDKRSCEAVAVGERFADGRASGAELAAAAEAGHAAAEPHAASVDKEAFAFGLAAGSAVLACARPGYLGERIHSFVGRYQEWSYAVMKGVDGLADAAAHWAVRHMDDGRDAAFDRALAAERAAQSDLLREILGNPFRSVKVEPGWLVPQVMALARVVYEDRRWGDLPVLADALEEAGCTDPAVLDHARSGGPHVRGCWLIDSLTGRS